MTDPLTPEQREVVERIRRGPHNKYTSFERIHDLLSVIDSLPAPKQYTEAELREGFASQYQDGLHVGENGEFTGRGLEADFAEWLECARFLGALKEPNA